MSGEKSAARNGHWYEFQGGAYAPTAAWINPFSRAFAANESNVAHVSSGAVVIAGRKPEYFAHHFFGKDEFERAEAARVLGALANHDTVPPIEDLVPFIEGIDRLRLSPNTGEFGLLIMRLEASGPQVARLGSTALLDGILDKLRADPHAVACQPNAAERTLQLIA